MAKASGLIRLKAKQFDLEKSFSDARASFLRGISMKNKKRFEPSKKTALREAIMIMALLSR
jgi:hypothetical protein